MTTEERVMDFTPVDFDVNHMEPNCAPGIYEAVIDKVKVSSAEFNGGRIPIVIVDWKMESSQEEGEEIEKSIGAVVSDRIRFYPPGEKKGNINKRQLRTLLEKVGVDQSVVPSRIESKSDFDELVGALTGQRLTIQIVHTEKANNDDPNAAPQIFENVRYSWQGQAAAEGVEEETQVRAKGGAGKPAKKAAAGGKGKR
jgi:hypothetical protein